MHFEQELIFQYEHFKFATPLDCAHDSDSKNCYNLSKNNYFLMLKNAFETTK